MASAVLDAEGNFAASSLLSSAEQSASAKLADALKTELAEEGDAAAVAGAFAAAVVGGEAAVTALAGGAGVMAAAAAGVAAGEAAATATTAAIATGPAAPIAVAAFAVPLILESLWGASGGVGCCGDPPDPSPWPVISGIPVSPSSGMAKDASLFGGVQRYESKAEALARALATARAANADSSCSGNSDWPSYRAPAKGTFQEFAYAMIRGAVDQAALFRCWPLAQVNFTKLVAMALDAWNATHTGPSSKMGVMIGLGEGSDPLTYAVRGAVPSDGTMTLPTGAASGFTSYSAPTWGGMPSKIVFLSVNTGPVISSAPHLMPIGFHPPPTPAPSPLGAHLLPFGLHSAHAAPATAPQRMTVDLALIGTAVGAGIGGPIGAGIGAAVGAVLGRMVRVPPPPAAA